MAGQPFKVGRFAHTLRVRLMREHLGVDVDSLYEEDLMAGEPNKEPYEQELWDPEDEQQFGTEGGVTRVKKHQRHNAAGQLMHDTLDEVVQGRSSAIFQCRVLKRRPVASSYPRF